MAATALRSEERIGLALALAAHGALFAWLALNPPAPAVLPPPERMSVTLSEDISLTSTAPQPQAEAAPDEAPELGEAPPPPAPEPVVQATPEPLPKPTPPKVQPRPAPVPQPRVAAKPAPAVAKPAPFKASAPPAAKAPAKPIAKPVGGSRIGTDFLKGVQGAQGKAKTPTPTAAAFGPQQQSALRAAIMRQMKPHWKPPQGIDAEKLVTQLRFNLNRNGTLAGEPVVVSQSGQTAANAAQVRRHAEQAVRAVKLAQPFILPGDLYAHWQTVTSTFDRRLSQ